MRWFASVNAARARGIDRLIVAIWPWSCSTSRSDSNNSTRVTNASRNKSWLVVNFSWARDSSACSESRWDWYSPISRRTW